MRKQNLNKSGVYAWYVDEGNESIVRYVGSAGSFESRKSSPLAILRKGKHRCNRLQDVFDELGEDKFKLVILEKCAKKNLYILEQKYQEIHKDTIYNKNKVRTLKKKVRRGKEASNHKKKFSEMFSGENNPNCRISGIQAGEILFLKNNTKLKHKQIAEMYGISSSQVSKIGKIRWKNVEEVEVEGYKIE